MNLRNWKIFLQGRVHRVKKSAAEIPADERFDSIVYDHVLEQIARDAEELRVAATRLAKGGRLIIVASAHEWLYSRLDRKKGMFRRYSREKLRYTVPDELLLRRLSYQFLSIHGVWEKRG